MLHRLSFALDHNWVPNFNCGISLNLHTFFIVIVRIKIPSKNLNGSTASAYGTVHKVFCQHLSRQNNCRLARKTLLFTMFTQFIVSTPVAYLGMSYTFFSVKNLHSVLLGGGNQDVNPIVKLLAHSCWIWETDATLCWWWRLVKLDEFENNFLFNKRVNEIIFYWWILLCSQSVILLS